MSDKATDAVVPPSGTTDPLAEVQHRQGHADRGEIEREMLRRLPAERLKAIDADPNEYVRAFDEVSPTVAERKKQERQEELRAKGGKVLKRELSVRESAAPPRPKAPPGPDPSAATKQRLLRAVREAPDEEQSTLATARYLQWLDRKNRGG